MGGKCLYSRPPHIVCKYGIALAGQYDDIIVYIIPAYFPFKTHFSIPLFILVYTIHCKPVNGLMYTSWLEVSGRKYDNRLTWPRVFYWMMQ